MMDRRFWAWCVHMYTSLGLVCAAGMAVYIVRGGDDSFRAVFLLMLVATVIDSTDGVMARAARVREVLPGFDGRRLDDLVDFLTYAFLPLLLLFRAGIPAGHTHFLVVPLLASAYGFCQVSIKTGDGYFLGFPSYWNGAAFYLYVLQPIPAWFSLAFLLTCSVLTFVPSRYLYPSQKGLLNRVTCVLAMVWGALVLWALYAWDPDRRRFWALLSGFFPLYYMVASWVVTVRIWRRGGASA